MLKDFFRDSAVYGSAKMLTGVVALLSLPVYTHYLSPAAYGVVDLLVTVAATVTVTVSLEISQGLARYILAPETSGFHSRYGATALWFTVVTYSVFVAVALIFARPISGILFGAAGDVTVVRVAILATSSTGVFYLLQNLLRYGRRPVRFLIMSVTYSAISFGVGIFLLVVVGAGPEAVFAGQLCGGIVACTLGLWFTRDTVGFFFDRPRCLEMLRFSLPLVPSGLGIMLCLYVDRYAVVQLLSVEALGIYGFAYRLAAVVAFILAGFQLALAPLIYQHYQEAETPAHIARIFRWLLAIAMPMILFLAIFSDEIVRIIAPAEYAGASRLVFVLSASMLVAGLYNFSPGLWIAKRTGWVAVISLGSGGLNLILNFLMIPALGLAGAAVATLISAAVACACHFVFGQRDYPLPFDWTRIGGALAVVVAVGIVSASGIVASDGRHRLVEALARGAVWMAVSAVTVLILLEPVERRQVVDQLRKMALLT